MRASLGWSAAVLLVGLFATSRARADEPSGNVEPPASYGLQTLAVDGASVAIVLTSILAVNGQAESAVNTVGVVCFAVATPIIHLVHGRADMAGISLGMRAIGIPLATLTGVLVASALPSGKSSASSNDAAYPGLADLLYGGIAGAGVGAVIATVIDAVVLAHENKAPASATPTIPAAPRVAFDVMPTFDPTRRTAGLGVVGTF